MRVYPLIESLAPEDGMAGVNYRLNE